jgi:hypothetical protein
LRDRKFDFARMTKKAPGDADQALSEIGMDAPVAFLVGVGQGAARDMPGRMGAVQVGDTRESRKTP